MRKGQLSAVAAWRSAGRFSLMSCVRPITTSEAIGRERKHAAQTYHPIPVVWERARDCLVWDVEGRRYLDFLAAYSAVNQGHCHPRLINAMVTQASRLELSSRAFYSAKFGEFAEFATAFFGYDRILPMNSGAEAVETALKICRKWGYDVRGVRPESAVIIVCKENFHGRTITIVSMSSDPTTKDGFGPYTPGFEAVTFGDFGDLERVMYGPLRDRIVAFLVEPIQGEAGVKIPPPDYLKKARKLCADNNVLFVTDEIQSGLGRAGSLLAYCGDCGGCEVSKVSSKDKKDAAATSGSGGSDFVSPGCACASKIKPDLIILGKALSGGLYPVSAVLGRQEVVGVIGYGQHGSTYGGNAIASAIGIEALKVLREERLVENSYAMGELFRKRLAPLRSLPWVADVRGRGLFNAVEVVPNATASAWQICLALAKRGLLCKPTHDHIIRLTPPLTIKESQIVEASDIIVDVFSRANKLTEADLIPDK